MAKKKAKKQARTVQAGTRKKTLTQRPAFAQKALEKAAEKDLGLILGVAQTQAGLRKLGPKAPWQVSIELISAPTMKKLNARYRGKDRPTDVLSFHPPEIFRSQGLLGELVICKPVLERQAREQGHSPLVELRILLVHGVLHLLGLDHELGPRQAAEMARWEAKVLEKLVAQIRAKGKSRTQMTARPRGGAQIAAQRPKGLIDRAGSGKP